MKKILGLGRGLESLIPTQKTTSINPKIQDSVFYIEINKIRPNSSQPRRDINQESLSELSESIKKYGVLQPLLVSKIQHHSDRGVDVEYELIAGERRWRAAMLAGLPHVPVIVKNNFDEARMKLEVALVENLQREDLNPLEEAHAFDRLTKEFGLTQREVSQRVGKSREVVANATRLLALPADIKEGIRNNKVSRSQARALLAFKDETTQRDMFKLILSGNFSVRDLEAKAKITSAVGKNKISAAEAKKFLELEKNLAENIGSTVLIRSGNKGGSIIIKFGDLEDLNKIVKAILD